MRTGSYRRPWLKLALAAGALPLSGCMTVIIEAQDAPVRVERGFGVLRVELPPAETAVSGHLSGAGIAFTPLGWHVGYTSQRWAAMGPQCHAAVWLDGTGLDPEARRWLAGLQQVCTLETTAPAATSHEEGEDAP